MVTCGTINPTRDFGNVREEKTFNI
jgi:hypothetical protein